MALCSECDAEFSDKRKELGYNTCLDCGDIKAEKESKFKAKCTAPLFNKGPYQYVANKSVAKNIGR